MYSHSLYVYIIIGLDVSTNISPVREHVIKDASLRKESVAGDKTDEGIKILDIEDAQETVIRDPSGEGEAGADPEPVRRAGKTELRGEERAGRGHQPEEGPDQLGAAGAGASGERDHLRQAG